MLVQYPSIQDVIRVKTSSAMKKQILLGTHLSFFPCTPSSLSCTCYLLPITVKMPFLNIHQIGNKSDLFLNLLIVLQNFPLYFELHYANDYSTRFGEAGRMFPNISHLHLQRHRRQYNKCNIHSLQSRGKNAFETRNEGIKVQLSWF